MNEFIVWHTLRKEFVQPYRNIVFDDSGIAESDLCTIHNYISLKDINDNKIYADCSIVEFYLEERFADIRIIGYYSFNVNELAYEIKVIDYLELEDDFTQIITPCQKSRLIKNIKIIDTIQENKLKLIKE